MIYIRTCAYNAEKTLKRTINSILNQTYGEYRYFILDNGSNDKTRELIRAYAEKDSRIIPFYCDINKDYTKNREFWKLPHNLEEEDVFCVIDADDVYEPTFLEEMLQFKNENELDIAICGSKFIDASSGRICADRVLKESLILSNSQSYDLYFPEVHWNLRQVWGKLYSAKAARAGYEIDFPEWFPKAYGRDTANVYESVKASEKIGVYDKALHLYTISSGSVSYKWHEGREECDFILFEKAKELLIEKCGYVSPRNVNFLYAVQFNALRDTLRVLFGSQLSAENKIEILKKIFENSITKQTFREEGHITQEDKTKLLTEVVCAVIEQAQSVTEKLLQDVADIYSVFNTDFSELIPTEHLGWYVKKLPILVRNVALGEYECGVNNLLVYLAKERGTDVMVDYPFVLGQVLASLRNEEAKYVYFSKQLIRWCLENKQTERARRDLEEWLQILPEDKELKEMDSMC